MTTPTEQPIEVHINTRDCEPMQPETAAALGRACKAVYDQMTTPSETIYELVVPTEQITDEQYGRRWASEFEVVPVLRQKGKQMGYQWIKPDRSIAVMMPVKWFETESEFYSALGRAVREVFKQVSRLKV